MTTSELWHMDFDMNHDCDFSELCDLLAQHNLTFTILIPHGPAGGNPYCRVSGSHMEVARFKLGQKIFDPGTSPRQLN